VSRDATCRFGKETKKRTETFMRQTGYLPRPPTLTSAPEILHVGSYPESSYIFQVSWKSVQGSRSCGGRKSPSPIDKAHGLYNTLYYHTMPKFHLARLDTTRHVRLCRASRDERVEPCCSNMADDEEAIVLSCTSLVVFMLLHTQILFVLSNEIN